MMLTNMTIKQIQIMIIMKHNNEHNKKVNFLMKYFNSKNNNNDYL